MQTMDRINFVPFPNLTTERLILRQLKTEDENEIFVLRSDERVMKFLDRPGAKSIDDARQFIKKVNDELTKKEGITWAITLNNDSKLIGTIGFWKIFKEHFRAEIGFLLHPDHHRKGIMSEAISTVLDYGFKILEFHSIEANVNPNNLASIKLLEKNKFIREAYFKENYFYNGTFLDTAIYSLINNKDEK